VLARLCASLHKHQSIHTHTSFCTVKHPSEVTRNKIYFRVEGEHNGKMWNLKINNKERPTFKTKQNKTREDKTKKKTQCFTAVNDDHGKMAILGDPLSERGMGGHPHAPSTQPLPLGSHPFSFQPLSTHSSSIYLIRAAAMSRDPSLLA